MADDMQPVTSDMLSDNNGSGAYISERFREPVAAEGTSSSGGNYIVSGIIAIVTFLLFLVMLGLLYTDFKELCLA